ncbi:hypothetical protein Pryu01_03068 [Paraliobacillus ryukyuensis]|uniref:Uncharacterized protein n=2 Tax=Paraliobacillus ryukyuensis TaxID=200904 RepID=A0A366DS52_9BACI|nr:hypothetical protein DES48_11537 [Paraliobacillus ryukyuensis]
MVGIDVDTTNNEVAVSDGYIYKGGEKHFIEGIYFNLDTDKQFEVVYDLYITINSNNDFIYELEKTYLDEGAMPCYTGDNKLFLTFVSVKLGIDGSFFEGHVTKIVDSEEMVENQEDKPETR